MNVISVKLLNLSKSISVEIKGVSGLRLTLKDIYELIEKNTNLKTEDWINDFIQLFDSNRCISDKNFSMGDFLYGKPKTKWIKENYLIKEEISFTISETDYDYFYSKTSLKELSNNFREMAKILVKSEDISPEEAEEMWRSTNDED